MCIKSYYESETGYGLVYSCSQTAQDLQERQRVTFVYSIDFYCVRNIFSGGGEVGNNGTYSENRIGIHETFIAIIITIITAVITEKKAFPAIESKSLARRVAGSELVSSPILTSATNNENKKK